MQPQSIETHYKNDFEKFLAHTNEKRILVDEITSEIVKYASASLLDIGAGNGLVSIPVARVCKRYCAVEKNSGFVEKLRTAGLAVVEGQFPIPVHDTFDMALVSHAISYKKDSFESFITEAWKLINPGGVFLIITFRGQEDDWTQLMEDIKEPMEDYYRTGFNAIIKLLYSLGEVTMRRVTTTVTTETLEDMLFALSFVASDGKAERKEGFLKHTPKLRKVLNSKYKTEHGYSFPFQHFFITTRKK